MNEMKLTFKIPGDWDDSGLKYEIVINLANGKAKVNGADYNGLCYGRIQLGELEIEMDAECTKRMTTKEGGFERSIFFDILW